MDKRTKKDIFENRKWVMDLAGCGKDWTTGYKFYIGCMLTLQSYLCCSSVYGAYLVAPNLDLIIRASHVMLQCCFVIGNLICRIVYDRQLHKMRDLVFTGIYQYDDEEFDEVQKKLRESSDAEIQIKTNGFVFALLAGGLSTLIFFPLSQLVFLEDNNKEHYNELDNPYSPAFFYPLLDPWTVSGYALQYVLSFIQMGTTYILGVAYSDIYVTCTVELKVHLKILNQSLRNLLPRAYKKYRRTHSFIQMDSFSQDLINDQAFRECLNSCLKSNIRHHQALKSYTKDCKTFLGLIITVNTVFGPIVYASFLYLVFQKKPPHVLFVYFITLLAEQMYPLSICIYGQEIVDESETLRQELYNLSWMYFDGTFNNSLKIIMANTLKPFIIRAIVIDYSATYESYGELVAVVYKIMNLWRQSDNAKK